jgi:hypothetical protein
MLLIIIDIFISCKSYNTRTQKSYFHLEPLSKVQLSPLCSALPVIFLTGGFHFFGLATFVEKGIVS